MLYECSLPRDELRLTRNCMQCSRFGQSFRVNCAFGGKLKFSVGYLDHIPVTAAALKFYPMPVFDLIDFFWRPPLSSLSWSSVKLSIESLKLKAECMVFSFLGLV